jgi:hypothetical protein
MIGRTVLTGQNSIMPTRVSADGSPKYKAGGITIDWGTVAASARTPPTPTVASSAAGRRCSATGRWCARSPPPRDHADLDRHRHRRHLHHHPDAPGHQPARNYRVAWRSTLRRDRARRHSGGARTGQAVSSSGGPLSTAAVPVVFGTFFPIVTVNAGTCSPAAPSPRPLPSSAPPAATSGRTTRPRPTGGRRSEPRRLLRAGRDDVRSTTRHRGARRRDRPDRRRHRGRGRLHRPRDAQRRRRASLALGPTLANLTTAFPRLSYVRD